MSQPVTQAAKKEFKLPQVPNRTQNNTKKDLMYKSNKADHRVYHEQDMLINSRS